MPCDASGMPKTTIATATPLRNELDRLAARPPATSPVLSLYLDMRPDQSGRRNHDIFFRKVFAERGRTFHGRARKSFEHDVQRIQQYLEAEVPVSVRGVALFACSAEDEFFDAFQLAAPFEDYSLFTASIPYLYPLAQLADRYPAYAALLVDTNSARLLVFRLGRRDAHEEVTNVKTRRTALGGWSQARYQRHCENFHLHHMKEVVAVLDRVVRSEALDHVVVAVDDTARPFLMDQLPKHLEEKVVQVLHLAMTTPEHDVLTETLDAIRQHDADTDAEQVGRVIDESAARGLGVVGPDATLAALVSGQVEELLIAARPDAISQAEKLPSDSPPGAVSVDSTATKADPERIKLAGELVARAHQNAARIRFIEDATLLESVGGVGAILRFRT
jgi:peptide chain release factor subunit 1